MNWAKTWVGAWSVKEHKQGGGVWLGQGMHVCVQPSTHQVPHVVVVGEEGGQRTTAQANYQALPHQTERTAE